MQAWPGKDSHDTIEYYNGRTVERQFTSWRDGSGYELVVYGARRPLATVLWRVAAAGSDSTVLTISLTSHLLDQRPRPVRWIPERLIVRPRLRRYLRSVVRGVEWRVTTGRPVSCNQFGSHSWFSP